MTTLKRRLRSLITAVVDFHREMERGLTVMRYGETPEKRAPDLPPTPHTRTGHCPTTGSSV
ncbi:hypothetical protein NOGI109294_15605 [Nocardiopsis gilva]|uniref:hypothetical protein n=1 Tax=Nocardiopsis gilva TaxID=280236 RepID=UPI000344CF52|nr:hypothetical protein [Nocardiopsis gilva]